jgi:hypothetical protein
VILSKLLSKKPNEEAGNNRAFTAPDPEGAGPTTALRDGRECREDKFGRLIQRMLGEAGAAALFERLRRLEDEAALSWLGAQQSAPMVPGTPRTRTELAAAAASSARGSCVPSDRSISEVAKSGM